LQTSQRCRNRVVCGLDRRRFVFLSQKSAHGCGKLARGLVFLQTPRGSRPRGSSPTGAGSRGANPSAAVGRSRRRPGAMGGKGDHKRPIGLGAEGKAKAAAAAAALDLSAASAPAAGAARSQHANGLKHQTLQADPCFPVAAHAISAVSGYRQRCPRASVRGRTGPQAGVGGPRFAVDANPTVMT